MNSTSVFSEGLKKEASRPSICLGFFQYPVPRHCGDRFCQICFAQCCGETEGNVSCGWPQCGANSPRRSSWDSQQLAGIAHSVQCLRQETFGGLQERGMCRRHREPLHIFCKDDHIPICPVCVLSKEHRHHTVIPIGDAFQDYQIRFQMELKTMKQWTEKLQVLMFAEESRTKRFLEDKNILSRCENQKTQEPMKHSLDLKKRLNTFSKETPYLEDFHRKFKDDLSFELESTSSLKHALGIPTAGSQIFDLPYAEVAERTGRKVNVTLDPDTANPFLILSADQKSVRLGDVWQNVSDNPERFDMYPCVLGCEGFTSGRHYWEVEVGSGRYWAVGVAKESVRRKGEVTPSPEEKIWALQHYGDYFEALTNPVTTLCLSSWPRKIQVFLDYEGNRVAFFDADTAALIYIFSPAAFSQERILPWLWVWPGNELRLY